MYVQHTIHSQTKHEPQGGMSSVCYTVNNVRCTCQTSLRLTYHMELPRQHHLLGHVLSPSFIQSYTYIVSYYMSASPKHYPVAYFKRITKFDTL